MTINSVGYPGTFAPASVWAKLQLGLGRRYFVASAADLVPTVTATGLTFPGGVMGGWGIVDDVVNEDLPIDAPASGVAYYMVCARRTWGSGAENRTVLTAIFAGSTTVQHLPVARQSGGLTAGTDDQPLWLVSRSSSGTTTLILDLRVIGTGPGAQQINAELALEYLTVEGLEVAFGNLRYRYGSTAAGLGAWFITNAFARGLLRTTGVIVTPVPAFPIVTQRAQKIDGVVHLRLQFTYNGTKILANRIDQANPGNITDTPMGKLAPDLLPQFSQPFLVQGVMAGTGFVSTDQNVYISSLVPNGYLDTTVGQFAIGVSYPAATP